MRRAADRYLYAEARERGAVSLNQKAGDGEGAPEIGELVRDARAPHPAIIAAARRCSRAMVSLTGREARILLAFADDVPLDDIAHEHGLPVLEVLSIKVGAAEKIQKAAFARVMTRRAHRPLRSLDMSQFGRSESASANPA